MKCSEDNKAFKGVVKKAYELGVMRGEANHRKELNKVLAENNVLVRSRKRLAHEVHRLNHFSPLEGTPVIIIPLKKAKSILGAIPNHIQNQPLIEYLTKLIGEQVSSFKS